MSPYKDKEKQRQSVREAVSRHRQGITGGSDKDVILYAQMILDKRNTLERILTSFNSKPSFRKYKQGVFYGLQPYCLNLEEVENVLAGLP